MGLTLTLKEGEPVAITHSDGSICYVMFKRTFGKTRVHFIANKDKYTITRGQSRRIFDNEQGKTPSTPSDK